MRAVFGIQVEPKSVRFKENVADLEAFALHAKKCRPETIMLTNLRHSM